MSIEKIAREDHLLLLKEATVTKVHGKHSGHLNESGAGPDGSLSLDKLETEKKMQAQLHIDADLNGDGEVSPSEAIINARRSNEEGSPSQDGDEVRNIIREQVLEELDLNGDGVVSLSETIVNARKYNQGRLMSQGGGKKEEMVRGQVPMDADLDGDGIVSPREAVVHANKDQYLNPDSARVQMTMGELAKMLAEDHTSLLVGPAEYFATLIKSLDLTQPDTQEFVNKILTDDDLSIIA